METPSMSLGRMDCWLRLSHLRVTPDQFVSVTVPWSFLSSRQQTRAPMLKVLDCEPVIRCAVAIRLGRHDSSRSAGRWPRYPRQFRFSPLNELCRSSPSEVMSRYSTSAKNDGSTHVALGFLMGFVSLDFGLMTVSSCFLISLDTV